MRDPSFSSTSKTLPDHYAGEFPRVSKDVTIKSGQNLTAGAVLGRVTATGEFRLSVTPAAVGDEGSEVPIAILIKDVDASAAAKEGPVDLTGEFDEAELTFGAGHTADSTRWDLHARGIHLKTTVAA